jgi:hypothetical protein
MFFSRKFRLLSYADSNAVLKEINRVVDYGRQPRTPVGALRMPGEPDPFDYSNVNPYSGKFYGKTTRNGIDIRYDLPPRGSRTVLHINVCAEKNGRSYLKGAYRVSPGLKVVLAGSLLFFWGLLGSIAVLVSEYTSPGDMSMMLFQGTFITLAMLLPILFEINESKSIDEPQMKKMLRDAINRAEQTSSTVHAGTGTD